MTQPPRTSSILDFLVPSVRDFIFVFLFWSVLVGPLSNRPLADPDIGWHIRTGELILSTHRLPRTDPFSSTMRGQPWFAWEWMYDVGLGVLHRYCGLSGVVWFCALVAAGIFALLFSRLVRRGAGLLLAVVLMLLAEGTATIHLYARPHIVTWLFTLLWFVALERWLEPSLAVRGSAGIAAPPKWLPWFFPASMLLWVNLHGGWLFGLALLAIYTFAAWVESLRARDAFAAIRARQRARGMFVAGLTSALATLVNPYGWGLHSHIYRYLGDRYLMNRIDEFKSPDFHGWGERCFAGVLLLTVIALVGQRRRLRLSHLLVILLAVYAGFYSVRNLPVSAMLLVLIAGPMLWENFAAMGEGFGGWRWLRAFCRRVVGFSERMAAQEMRFRGHVWPWAAAVVGLGICLHGGWLGPRQLVYAGFDSQKLPEGAVGFLLGEAQAAPPVTGPVFSTDAWGGYLIYRMYPQRKVVFDDRHDLYGSGRVEEYLVAMHGEPGWRAELDRLQVETALLPDDCTLANLLREVPREWRIVYEDKVAVVFEKAGGR